MDFSTPLNETTSVDEYYEVARLHVMFLLYFISLYLACYPVISYLKVTPEYSEFRRFYDVEEVSNRIALWLCNFSLANSVGILLLFPLTILANELLYRYPNSSSINWITPSCVHGMWSHSLLCSNISLFFFMPFAYFFTEAEPLNNSKGLLSRFYDTVLIFLLFGLLLVGFLVLGKSLLGTFFSPFLQSNLESYVSFSYSFISFIAALLLLACAPH
eukprot:Sdes_comp20577_c0_seq2m15483